MKRKVLLSKQAVQYAGGGGVALENVYGRAGLACFRYFYTISDEEASITRQIISGSRTGPSLVVLKNVSHSYTTHVRTARRSKKTRAGRFEPEITEGGNTKKIHFTSSPVQWFDRQVYCFPRFRRDSNSYMAIYTGTYLTSSTDFEKKNHRNRHQYILFSSQKVSKNG